MKKIFTLSLAFFLASFNYINAEQLLGVSITYRNIGSFKYAVTYKVYTDKSDTIAFKKMEFKVHSGSASIINSPKFIKTHIYKYGCEPYIKETYISTYQDTIDLNLLQYSSIKNSGDCRTYFTCKYSDRYTNLKNIAPNAYFTYAFINTCNAASNTSPISDYYNSVSINYLCINRGYYLSSGFSDTTNFDSIACYFATPYNGFNSKINYDSGYSLSDQFDNYKPSGYSGPPIPGNNPPIGIFIDNETGDLIFTPTKANSSYVSTSELIEYRKNGNKYMEVGGILSDFVLQTYECPYNNPPILFGPFKHEVGAGQQLCFTIKSDDKTFIPPPPQKLYPPDSVRLTWNRGIPGATFTIVDLKARLQQGKFCWTPKLTSVSNLPYVFTVTARDNACPRNEITIMTYSIKVTEPINSISKSNPKNIKISPNPSPNGELIISSDNFKFNEIALFDITGKQLMSWEFEQTDQFSKNLSYLASGVYFIKCANGREVFDFKWIRE